MINVRNVKVLNTHIKSVSTRQSVKFVQKITTQEHTHVICANCKETHKANSVECEIYKSLKPHSSSADPLAIEEDQ